LPLWYPINEKLPQLRSKFFGAGSSKVRKGALEKKLARWGSLHKDPKRKVSKQQEHRHQLHECPGAQESTERFQRALSFKPFTYNYFFYQCK
jgi:hypothetical protein